MKCSQCNKLIAEADFHYVEVERDAMGTEHIVPKYWILRGTTRELFCSPHCATEWNKHNTETTTTPTTGTENTTKQSKKKKKKR